MPDQLIKGTERDPAVRSVLLEDPRDGAIENEVDGAAVPDPVTA
jgi:hypothetical protein